LPVTFEENSLKEEFNASTLKLINPQARLPSNQSIE
jgi:hypothetical protein